ncbi:MULTISPECIES: hypothetical protein [unclassified Moritella]|uniref:hypothetical protein n=1 Tax=unclassified Moritella TaxID=2637987 RepID=UPI001BA5E54C|nr:MULTISPECIES: hypothetical protein [unclassified Moritella]QUM84776.1 hypothetical protein HWV02_09820 [Moritella sp. 28]QUM89022.1 hypothetical protein HWV03_09540 [Moritella sp. 36]
MEIRYATYLTKLTCITPEDTVFDNTKLDCRIDSGEWKNIFDHDMGYGMEWILKIKLVFKYQIELRLRDYDDISATDELGTAVISPDDFEGQVAFTGDGAHYTLDWSTEPYLIEELEAGEEDYNRHPLEPKLIQTEIEKCKSLNKKAFLDLPYLFSNGFVGTLTSLLATHTRMAAGDDSLETSRSEQAKALVRNLLPVRGLIKEFANEQYGTIMLCGDVDTSTLFPARIGMGYGIAISIDLKWYRVFVDASVGFGTNVGASGSFWFGFNRNTPDNVGGATFDIVRGFDWDSLNGSIATSFDINLDFTLSAPNIQEVCYGMQAGAPVERSGGLTYCYVFSKFTM